MFCKYFGKIKEVFENKEDGYLTYLAKNVYNPNKPTYRYYRT